MNPKANHKILSETTYDYSKLQKVWRLTKYAYYRWEIFGNPLFRDYDNVLYVDVDTEIIGGIGELFNTHHEPGIYTADVEYNWLLE